MTSTAIHLPHSRQSSASRRRQRRWPQKLLSGLAIAALGLTALAGSGALYEAIASRFDAAPATGQLVDVGGHSLYIACEGNGQPTIVMDAGLGGSSLDWILVQSQLAQSARVCVYDRAGMGRSEPGPLPRSPGRIAEELHRLLDSAGIEGPYLLVGHSLAGKHVRMFAAAYPDDVAGMVLIDARSERMDLDASAAERDGMNSALNARALLYAVTRQLGLVRLFGASLTEAPKLSPDAAHQLILRETQPSAIRATVDEGLARAADDDALSATTLGNLPLVVVASSDNMSTLARWPDAQEGLARLSSRGRLVVAEPSSHYVQFDQPGVVIDAVLSVLADARAHH